MNEKKFKKNLSVNDFKKLRFRESYKENCNVSENISF